jgi:hypothetical protein
MAVSAASFADQFTDNGRCYFNWNLIEKFYFREHCDVFTR